MSSPPVRRPASSSPCRAPTRASASARPCRVAALRGGGPGGDGVRARRDHARRRPDAAVFHLRHHVQAQARAAHARRATRSAISRPCTGSPEAWRHPPEHLFAGVGQARLELLLRAVERGRMHLHLQLRPIQCPGTAECTGAAWRHQPVRTAHGVAHADSRKTSRRSRGD